MSSGRDSRNSSAKTSSWMSSHALVVLGRLDAQQLLLVVPLVQRARLVEALVALQADERRAGRLGDRLGQLGLADAGRALDEQRLAEPVGEEDGRRDGVVGEVAGGGQPLGDVGRTGELGRLHGHSWERRSWDRTERHSAACPRPAPQTDGRPVRRRRHPRARLRGRSPRRSGGTPRRAPARRRRPRRATRCSRRSRRRSCGWRRRRAWRAALATSWSSSGVLTSKSTRRLSCEPASRSPSGPRSPERSASASSSTRAFSVTTWRARRRTTSSIDDQRSSSASERGVAQGPDAEVGRRLLALRPALVVGARGQVAAHRRVDDEHAEARAAAGRGRS